MSDLHAALEAERPLQLVGVVNAYSALLAREAGFRALYLSGAGVANAAHGLPDLALTTLSEVVGEVRRLTAVTELPLLVDADTGFGDGLMIGRTVRELSRAGAAGMHIEDQVAQKRCGHRLGKQLVGAAEMEDRIKAAVDARADARFVIMARTDALADEGMAGALERGGRYRDAGADMLFLEAAHSLEQYAEFAAAVGVPVLANMTEFGVSPLHTTADLAANGVALVLYPLTAFRAMSAAALEVLREVRRAGSQAAVLDRLQTRSELYRILGYEEYERRMDELLATRSSGGAQEESDG